MTAIILEGVPPWDGRYDLDGFEFTNRELFQIKQISQLRAAELIDALDAHDTAAYVAVAVIAAARQGKIVPPDDLWEANFGSISLDLEDDAPANPTPDQSGEG